MMLESKAEPRWVREETEGGTDFRSIWEADSTGLGD